MIRTVALFLAAALASGCAVTKAPADRFNCSSMRCARSSPSPVSPPFEIASVSKPIGATLLMQLVEQGRLSLDDPMSKYSRDYKGDAVRVRHVLTHTSEGVPGERYEYNGNLFDNLTDVAIAASVKRYRVLLADAIIDPLGMTNTSPGNDIADGLPKMEELLGAARARCRSC